MAWDTRRDVLDGHDYKKWEDSLYRSALLLGRHHQPTSPSTIQLLRNLVLPRSAKMHSNMIASVLLAATAMAAPALEDRSTGGRVNDPNIANFNNGNIHDGIGKGRDEYRMYWGNGSPSQGWPGKDRWVSFEDM